MTRTLLGFTSCILVSLLIPISAKAELIFNDRTALTMVVEDAHGCAGEDVDATFLLHELLSTTRKGFTYHYNIDGVFVGQDTGREWIWKEVFSDTVPINTSGTFRGTRQHRIAVIGKGQQADFWLKYRLHLVVNSGQVASYFDSLEIVCTS